MKTVEPYEMDNRTGINHEGAHPNNPVQRLTATSIIGDHVENPQGEDLGKIDNLMINLSKGEVEYVIVEFGAFMGIAGKLFAIPFNEFKPHPQKKAFVLNRDKEYLKTSPGFDRTHWPDTNEHAYFESVSMLYGDYVPPFP